MIPGDDATAATVEAQAAGETIERRGIVADDATNDQWLDGMAVGTTHAHDMLSHEPRAFIVVAFVAAFLTAVSLSLCHGYPFFIFTALPFYTVHSTTRHRP